MTKFSFAAFTIAIFSLFIAKYTVSDVLDVYIGLRKEASCKNVDVCNEDLLQGYFNSSDIVRDSNCCSLCGCSEQCFRRGDCCPDILSDKLTVSNIPQGGLYRCVHGRLKSSAWSSYLMITKCPTNYTNPEIIQKCRNDPLNGLDFFVPVSSNIFGDTYRNQYCAECNFEEPGSLTSWNVQLGCKSEPIKKISPKTLINDVLAAVDCDLYLTPPHEIVTEDCSDLIDTCNQTRLWQNYDPYIAAGCELFRAPFFDRSYRNIFCYMCNVATETPANDCFTSKFDETRPLPSFTLLFDFNNAKEPVKNAETRQNVCPVGTEFIPSLDTCFVTNCEKGFKNIDGECKPDVNNLCLEAFLVLRPMVDISEHNVKDILHVVENEINESTIIAVHALSAWDIHWTKETSFVFHLKFIYNISICRGLVEFFKQPFYVTLLDKDVGLNTSLVFVIPFDVTFQDEITEYLQFRDPFENTTLHAFYLPDIGWTQSSLYNNDDSDLLCSMDGRLTVLTQFMYCLWIEVELRYFNVTFIDNGLYFNDTGFTLPNKSFDFIDSIKNNSIDTTEPIIKVCVRDFAEYASFVQQDSDLYFDNSNLEELKSEFLGYLTLTTSILSICSSLFILITYVILKPLQTQPGINNMMLSVFICFGHFLFIFGLFHGYSELICLFMGGLLHFFWLSVMLWYLVCSFHMFRVFHQPIPVKDKCCIKTSLKYLTFVTVISVCLIAVNVVVSVMLSEKEDFGYKYIDGRLCWISRPICLGLTITLPALLSVICNIILFGIAVYRIGNGINVELRSNKNRKTFLIYIKLSVLTGLTWLTIIPYIFTKNEVFNYIFTCLNGLNGVFLVAAFLINKRVYHLYKSFILGQDMKPDRSSGSNTSK